MWPEELNDLVGLPRTDGNTEIILPSGQGTIVVPPDQVTYYVVQGGIVFDEYTEI